MPRTWVSFRLVRLEPNLFVGRKGYQMHRIEHVLGNARPYAAQGAVVHDRREHHAIDRELLDAMEQRFALARVALARLLVEQIVEIRVAAVRVAALGIHERLDPARRIARVADRGHEEPAKLLLAPGSQE